MRVYEALIKWYWVYAQNHIARRAVCYDFPLVRDKLIGAPAFVKLVYYLSLFIGDHSVPNKVTFFAELPLPSRVHRDPMPSVGDAVRLLAVGTRPSLYSHCTSRRYTWWRGEFSVVWSNLLIVAHTNKTNVKWTPHNLKLNKCSMNAFID